MRNFKRIIFLSIVLCAHSLFLFSIPPVAGLGLVEPQYPRIPFSPPLHTDDFSPRRSLDKKHLAPNINLAPRGLLILVNFADITFSPENTQQAFDSLANGDNYTYNGATGSCKSYFAEQSNGQYIPQFDVVGPLTLPQTAEYYGFDTDSGDDRYIADFVIDACRQADNIGLDFSQYDNDQDGLIDFVYIIYAGFGQADGGPKSTIWPHNWDLISALYFKYTNQNEYYAYYDANDSLCYNLPMFDNKYLYTYACSNELRFASKTRTGIGTICHEFCHVLGLPDYYITQSDYIQNSQYTPGAWSLMGYGNYLNDGNTPPNFSIYDKYFLGWLEPQVLDATDTIQLFADGQSGFLLARNEMHLSDKAYRTDTVYYLENRQQTGWDTYLPGHGMLIWRVIYDENSWYNNSPNDDQIRYLLISANPDGTPYADNYPRPDVPFPGTTNQTTFSPFSVNAISHIQESADGVISFVFSSDEKTPVENIPSPPSSSGQWYNLLGQPIDPATYRGIAIYNEKKYLLP